VQIFAHQALIAIEFEEVQARTKELTANVVPMMVVHTFARVTLTRKF
jgi:hypothetical protein